MGFLNTSPQDDANLAVAGTGQGAGTTELPNPGFWRDAAGAVGRSVVGGAASVEETAEDIFKSGATDVSEYGQDLEHSLPVVSSLMGANDPGMAMGAMQQAQDMPEAEAPTFESMQQADRYRDDVIAWAKLDPRTTGAFGMTLGPIAKGLTEAGIGSVAGPWGAASLMGGASADETYHSLRAQGVDEKAATEAATAQGVFSGVGAFLPLKYGSTAVKSILGGAAVNLGFGIADREAQAKILEANGYADMANQVRPFAFQSMFADSILGAAFGTMGHFTGETPLPSEVDAASAVAAEAHFNDLAPGVPTRPDVANAHVNTLAEALDAMANDRDPAPVDPDVAQTIADGIVMDPARMELAQHAAEAIAEVPQARDVMAAPELPDEPELSLPSADELAAAQDAVTEAAQQLDQMRATETPADDIRAQVEQLATAQAQLQALQDRAAPAAPAPADRVPVTGDPVDDRILDGIVAKYGNNVIELPDGRSMTVAQHADELRQDMAQATEFAKLHDVAVACFLRTGAAA